MVVVEPRDNPGRYDLEVPLLLHEWDPFFSPEKDGDINYKTFSINGKMLGAGEPVRVKPGQRVLFRILNASATLKHRLALPRHKFEVVALDGNPAPRPASVPVLELGPGERIDAFVEMTTPGAFILGEEDSKQRAAGAGIVVEYSGARGPAQWAAPPPYVWDLTAFGVNRERATPDATLPLVFEPQMNGHLYSINGKSYPNTDPILVRNGSRTRLIFDNRSREEHPMHLHRHAFELVKVAGTPTAGVMKDVVVVPPQKAVEVDVVANNPGPSLFHCHQQFHMDFGFMAIMQYAT
jgi:FtsP/CotA-like multicopper oxidase with cupredoxin domain